VAEPVESLDPGTGPASGAASLLDGPAHVVLGGEHRESWPLRRAFQVAAELGHHRLRGGGVEREQGAAHRLVLALRDLFGHRLAHTPLDECRDPLVDGRAESRGHIGFSDSR
jgi:hypothetical protein